MSIQFDRARVRLRGEQGMTLVELLVATLIGIAVLGGGVAMMASAMRSEPRVSERSDQIQTARTTLERLTRELRQAWSVPLATSSQLSVLTYVRASSCGGAPAATSIKCRVNYACTATSCTRAVRTTANTGSAPAETVVSGISSASFSYLPTSASPTWIGAALRFPQTNGAESVTISDGAGMRNAGLAQ
jgi:Tfp pilus assembly protein PilW